MGGIARDVEYQFNSIGGVGCHNCDKKNCCWMQSCSSWDDNGENCEEWSLLDPFEDY